MSRAVGVIDAGRSIAARGAQAMAMQRQARQVGGCERPVRVAGRGRQVDIETGEITGSWSTEDLPDGVLHVRCKDRRASRCKPCSLLYQDDAYQLTRAGLAGGKGVPESVQAHPAVFVTLTAPSFGLVHTRTLGRDGRAVPCRARRDQQHETCVHGRPVACTRRHRDDDPALGTPLCAECFDYGGAIAWNHHASELWRRTTIRVYRELAALLRRSESTVKREVRLSYVKVAEWQRRGLIHFHAAARLDAKPQDDGDPEHAPPPEGYTLDVLDAAIRAAVAHVTVPYPRALQDLCRGGRGSQGLASDAGGCAAGTLDGTGHHISSAEEPRQRFVPRRPCTDEPLPGDLRLPNVDPRPRTHEARWGRQVDVRPIHPTHLVAIEDQLRVTDHDQQGLSRGQIAGYLAKYATKDTEVLAQLRPNLDIYALATLRMPEHVRRLTVCAWLQGRAWHVRDERHLRARRWVHQFGYGGHYLTKSRRYSTTFTRLRQARRDWHLTRRRAARAREAERRIAKLAHTEPAEHVQADDHADSAADPERFVLAVRWRLDGIGWRTVGDAFLAQTARQQALNARDEARAQRAAERALEPWID
jgi:hypothetical protein